MIDVSGGQLQSLYPASHHRTVVGHGGYPSPECLASSSSESAVSSSSSSSSSSTSGCAHSKSIRQEETVTVRSAGAVPSTTAVTMLGCAHSSGQETPPSRILSFPFQKDAESSQKDLAGCWSHDALLTQRHSGASCSLQSPLQSKKQQEVDACGQMSLSRCPPHSDIPLSSDRLCTAVSSPSNTVLPSLTATSVAPSASLSSSSSSSSCAPPQQEPDKHSSPNPHQVLSPNRDFLHSQLHHGQQLFQQQNQSCVLQPHHFRPGSTTTTTSDSSAPSPGVGTTEDFSPRGMFTCTTTSAATVTTTTNSNSSSNNINVGRYSGSCSGGVGTDHSSEEDEECCGYNRQSMDYITDKLQRQMVLDSASPLLRSQRQQQESSVLLSAEDRFSLPLRPSASVTNTGADSVKSQISLSKSSGLNTTLQGLLSLNIEDSSRKVYSRTLFPSDTCTNQNLSLPAALHSLSASSSSPLISEGLVPTTHGYGTSLPSNTSKICEDIILPITAGEGAGHAAASDVSSDNSENLKDTSPGTPPYPPKKKHCRSLSIPSENSWNISSRLCYKARGDVPTMVTLSNNNNNNNNHQNYSAPLELSSRNFGSLLKPAAFQLVTEGNNWGRQCLQNFTSGAEGEERGEGRAGTVAELSGISSSASFPSLRNSNNSTSFPCASPSHWPTTMMDQPPPPLSSSSSSSCDVRLNTFSSDILNSTTTTTITTSATTSTTVKPTQFKALGSAPHPQPLFQTQHTPPHSPVPRAASVSILGHSDENIDEELDGGRAVSFKPVCWTSQGYNSDFSSPSSCSPSSSSSSSFLLRLQPPPNTTTPTGSLSFPPSSFSSFSSFLTTTTTAVAAHAIPTLSKSYLAAPLTITTADASSSSLSSSPSSSSSPIKMAAGSSVTPQTPFWSFQKHRSFSLEDKCSSSSTPTTATFIGHSTSPLSSLSPFTSPPATHHPTPLPPQSFSSHHPHQYPHSTRQQAPMPSPPMNTMIPPHVTPPHTQQYLLPPNQHHHHHHQHHQHHQQQQQTQLQQQQQLVTCSGSTPSVPAACKTSMSNPSSPRRHRIPRCRSQPCVLHDRKTGVKRRRDYDRPTLDFHKMTQTAYGSPTCQTEANEQTSQNLYQGPNTTVKYSQFSEDQTQTVKWDRNVLMSTSMPASSMEVLRSASLLPDTHSNDDAMSEDAEISAATEAAEAAAIAAAVAANNSEQFFPNISPQSIIGQHIDDSDSSCTPWEDSCFQRSFISSAPQSVGSAAGWGDPCVYISDESNPSFCGCDADDVEEITENEDFYSRNKPPIADLDLDQIENH